MASEAGTEGAARPAVMDGRQTNDLCLSVRAGCGGRPRQIPLSTERMMEREREILRGHTQPAKIRYDKIR